jgi:hypothetical protein
MLSLSHFDGAERPRSIVDRHDALVDGDVADDLREDCRRLRHGLRARAVERRPRIARLEHGLQKSGPESGLCDEVHAPGRDLRVVEEVGAEERHEVRRVDLHLRRVRRVVEGLGQHQREGMVLSDQKRPIPCHGLDARGVGRRVADQFKLVLVRVDPWRCHCVCVCSF